MWSVSVVVSVLCGDVSLNQYSTWLMGWRVLTQILAKVELHRLLLLFSSMSVPCFAVPSVCFHPCAKPPAVQRSAPVNQP